QPDAPDGTVELVIETPARALVEGFKLTRALPSTGRRMAGPFIFLDQMGPEILRAGKGLDVRPHPHIGLGTVTYLFDGELLHRDSLGTLQPIRPGAINWMVAGRGIVHSERSPAEARTAGARAHGLQLWVALPTAHEEMAPSFQHHPAATLPERTGEGAHLRILAGTAYGASSPVAALSPLVYVEARL